jgi:RsiW-degrading membrane proteinase PrsW (M82 family)
MTVRQGVLRLGAGAFERSNAEMDAPIRQVAVTRHAYLLFLAAFAPLAFFRDADPHDVEKRIRATARAVPELASLLAHGGATDAEICRVLPAHKIVGAHLACHSFVPWAYAAAAATLFLIAIRLLFPSPARTRALLGIGAFTGTVGMVLLIAFQYVAEYSQGLWIHGFNVAVLLFYIVKFIGFSYRAALDPSNGLVLSFVGFTCGVGLCEELTKALPVLHRLRRRPDGVDVTATEAAAWGLASGVGFGVAEGIHYAATYYDGFATWPIYVVRFVSCVGLHATWSGAVGYTFFEERAVLRADRRPLDWLVLLVRLLFVPMVLHGLYDTLLKRDMDGTALVIAIVSFVWLGGALERARRGAEPAVPAADVI